MKSQASRLREENSRWQHRESEVETLVTMASAPVDSNYTDIVALNESYSTIAEDYSDELYSNAELKERVSERISDKLLYVLENAKRYEQEVAALLRTRTEWEAMEQEHVMEAQTLDDMELAMDKLLRAGRITKKQVEFCRERMRRCSAWDCDSVYVVKDLRQKYCSGQCEREQNAAERRFKANGTYMPREYYIDKRSESIEKARSKKEVAFTDEMAELYEESGSLVAKGKRRERLIHDQVDDEMKKYEKEGKLFAEKAQFTAFKSSIVSQEG